MQTLAPQMQSQIIDANYLANLTKEIAEAYGIQLSAITDIGNDKGQIDYAIACLRRDGKWIN